MRDFQTHFGHLTWGWVEELLGVRPPQNLKARKESFSLKMVWLKQQMQHIPPDADPNTLRQYARRYSWGSAVLAWTYRSLSTPSEYAVPHTSSVLDAATFPPVPALLTSIIRSG
ncbi:hypothetical protein PIB30_059882 [Stylosanthes scabra]|uniref:Uncharacterized protein n=1 Tax=Stylosanthes scabra TaxID=79078 RepID=A0ABU6VIS4_9FABA|nr:hypothetical protein [Stylosanthes scabra]